MHLVVNITKALLIQGDRNHSIFEGEIILKDAKVTLGGTVVSNQTMSFVQGFPPGYVRLPDQKAVSIPHFSFNPWNLP